MTENYPRDVWECSMIGCPSQCYFRTTRNGIDYILYLRWRWDDPWQAHIAIGAHDDICDGTNDWLSNDIFEERDLFFKDDEVEAAKEALLKIFNGLYPQE